MTEFQNKCYKVLKQVPKNKITTYKDLAKAIGHPKAYRAVGTAMNKNPFAPKVPCHRVINSNGELGQFAFGQEAKQVLLQKEGLIVKSGKVVDFKKYLFSF